MTTAASPSIEDQLRAVAAVCVAASIAVVLRAAGAVRAEVPVRRVG
jgi:hypothetical protein